MLQTNGSNIKKGKHNRPTHDKKGKKYSYWNPPPGSVYVKEYRRDLGCGRLMYVPMFNQDKLVDLVGGSWAKINRHKIVQRFLRAKYPQSIRTFKPLAKNINGYIMKKHCHNSKGVIQPKMVEIFGDILKTHCNSLQYLVNTLKYRTRFNLDGTPAERISDKEKAYALQKLREKIERAEARDTNKISHAYREAKKFLSEYQSA
jgi:proQ/FINO family